MKKFLSFGDIHFSSINEWNERTGEKFIKWFEAQDFGNPEDVEIGFAGDISERDVNPGNVVDQMDRFFTIVSSKFKHCYITVGNHDKKKYHEVYQHSLKFLENKKNITVVDKEKVITTENGFKVLFLPHQVFNDVSLWDYYNNLDESWTSPMYDVIFGHWNIQEDSNLAWKQRGVDISRFKAHCMSLGHIHNRIRDEYVGSCWPNNCGEFIASEFPYNQRGYKVLNEDRTVEFVNMPHFLVYKRIELGQEPEPVSPDYITVYTVTNCISQIEAEEKYPNLYINNVERETLFDSNEKVAISTASIADSLKSFMSDPVAALDQMIKEKGLNVSRSTYNTTKSILQSAGKKASDV